MDSRSKHKIGNQTFITRGILTRYDQACLNSRIFIEYGNDLSRFDTVAPNLDLLIIASQKRDLTIW